MFFIYTNWEKIYLKRVEIKKWFKKKLKTFRSNRTFSNEVILTLQKYLKKKGCSKILALCYFVMTSNNR